MDIGLIQSVWTLIAFITFIAIVFWAFSDARKEDFKEASQLPLEDDLSVAKDSVKGAK
jgi:cytochrome c oxidase cbb3-type subunit 4